LSLDLQDILFSENDEILGEAQERMYKAEMLLTWEHFSFVLGDSKTQVKAIRQGLNEQI
jgi:hypothetical protein